LAQNNKTPVNKISPGEEKTIKTGAVNNHGRPSDVVVNNTGIKSSAVSASVQTEGKIPFVTSTLNSEWIADDVLQIYFDLINSKIPQEHSICIVNPVIVQAAKCLTGTEIDAIISPLKLESQQFIFLPISDSDGMKLEASGCHWSLLVYIKACKKFYHFDSIGTHNFKSASKVAEKVSSYIDPTVEHHLISQNTPQQNNSIDCGVYMVMITEILISRILSHNFELSNIDVLLTLPMFNELDIWTKRAQLASIVFNSDTSCIRLNNIIPMLINSAKYTYLNPSTRDDLTVKEMQNKIKHLEDCLQFYIEKLIEQDTQLENLKCYKDEQLGPHSKQVKAPSPDKITAPGKRNHVGAKVKSRNRCHQHPKINLACDSHGREMYYHMEQVNENNYKICNFTQPGAPIEKIISQIKNDMDLKKFTKEDFVVLIGGTNNISHNTLSENPYFLNKFTTYMERQIGSFEHTNLILSTIPYRHDLIEGSMENELIMDVNFIIRNIAHNHKNIHLLDLHFLDRNHHTRHGLHINKRGKKFVAKEIFKIIAKCKLQEDSGIQTVVPSHRNDHLDIKPASELNKEDSDKGTSDFVSDVCSELSPTPVSTLELTAASGEVPGDSEPELLSVPSSPAPSVDDSLECSLFSNTSQTFSPNCTNDSFLKNNPTSPLGTPFHGFPTPDKSKLNSIKGRFLAKHITNQQIA